MGRGMVGQIVTISCKRARRKN